MNKRAFYDLFSGLGWKPLEPFSEKYDQRWTLGEYEITVMFADHKEETGQVSFRLAPGAGTSVMRFTSGTVVDRAPLGVDGHPEVMRVVRRVLDLDRKGRAR